jgi:hypothetical protein
MREATRRHIPEDSSLYSHGPGNLKWHILFVVLAFINSKYLSQRYETGPDDEALSISILDMCISKYRVIILSDDYRSPLPVGASVVLKQLTNLTVYKHCGTAAASDKRNESVKTRILCEGSFFHSRPETNDTQNCVTAIHLLKEVTHSHTVWILSDFFDS